MASRLLDYFLMCWTCGTLTEQQLNTAVEKGYITLEEKQHILATTK